MVISEQQLAGFEDVAVAFLSLVRSLRTDEASESVTPHCLGSCHERGTRSDELRWVTIEEAVGYANGRFKDRRRLKATLDRIYDDPKFVTGAIAGKHCDRSSRGTKGRHYYQILVPTFFEVL